MLYRSKINDFRLDVRKLEFNPDDCLCAVLFNFGFLQELKDWISRFFKEYRIHGIRDGICLLHISDKLFRII